MLEAGPPWAKKRFARKTAHAAIAGEHHALELETLLKVIDHLVVRLAVAPIAVNGERSTRHQP
jgi:hypothetical protein